MSISKTFTGKMITLLVASNVLTVTVMLAVMCLFSGNLLRQEAHDAGTPSQEIVSSIASEPGNKEIAELQVVAKQSLHRLAGWSLLAALVAIGASAGIGFVLLHRALSPLHQLRQGLEEIAQGRWDLTRRFHAKTHDDVSETMTGVNALLGNLQTMIHKVADSSSTLSDSSVDISASSIKTAAKTEEMSNQSGSVAAAAEQLTVNIHGMAKSTDEMSASTKAIATTVEEMTASISEVAQNAEQAASAASEAAELAHGSNETIRHLGDAADEIGKVIEVIQDIAEQTNLLALNATIEAARAGEAGKGFAVVATEVKELARQTAAATEDISQRIEGMQRRTTEAVDAIGKISQSIGNVSDVSRSIASAVEEQSITTKDIASNVTQNSEAVDFVAQNIAESATVSQEISRNIGEVDGALKEAAECAIESQAISGQLIDLSGTIQSVVSQFKTDARCFRAGAVKSAHAKWRAILAELLAGKRALRVSEMPDHKTCAFGKWYYSDGIRELGQFRSFKAIEKLHAEVHQMAKTIVELYNGKKYEQAAEQLEELQHLTENLFGVLDELEQESVDQSVVSV